MTRALIFIILLLTAVVGSVLARLNFESVNFYYYFGTIETSLALLLTIVFAGGSLLGLLMTVGMTLSSQISNRRLHKILQLREQEIRNLRDIPIKGQH